MNDPLVNASKPESQLMSYTDTSRFFEGANAQFNVHCVIVPVWYQWSSVLLLRFLSLTALTNPEMDNLPALITSNFDFWNVRHAVVKDGIGVTGNKEQDRQIAYWIPK